MWPKKLKSFTIHVALGFDLTLSLSLRLWTAQVQVQKFHVYDFCPLLWLLLLSRFSRVQLCVTP